MTNLEGASLEPIGFCLCCFNHKLTKYTRKRMCSYEDEKEIEKYFGFIPISKEEKYICFKETIDKIEKEENKLTNIQVQEKLKIFFETKKKQNAKNKLEFIKMCEWVQTRKKKSLLESFMKWQLKKEKYLNLVKNVPITNQTSTSEI